MGRIASGVRAIKLEKDDEVVAMELVEPGQELMVVTKKGYGKRTKAEDYKVQVRGGKGLLTYDKAKFKKTGELVGAMVVSNDDDVLLINSDGIIIRISVSEVSKLGRATQGVKIMNVADDVDIIALAKVAKNDELDAEIEEAEKSSKEDKDNDGQFNVEEDNVALVAKGDIVSYSFYSFDPTYDSEGWDSEDNYYTGDERANLQCPAFTLPKTPGDYRMRIKVDWNSLDPAGDDIQGIIKNGGYITDITLRILTPEGVKGQQTTVNRQQSTVYDLRGRIVKGSEKSGIILVNGKKVVR